MGRYDSRREDRRDDRPDGRRELDSHHVGEPDTGRIAARPVSRRERKLQREDKLQERHRTGEPMGDEDTSPGYASDFELRDQIRERLQNYPPGTRNPEERARNEIAREEARAQARQEREAGLEHTPSSATPGYYTDPALMKQIEDRKRLHPIGTANLEERVRHGLAREEARHIAQEEARKQEVRVTYVTKPEPEQATDRAGADRPDSAQQLPPINPVARGALHQQEQERDPESSRQKERREAGHRDNYDRRLPRIGMEERKMRAVADLGHYRVAAVKDISESHFGGNPFTTRKAIDDLVKRGYLEEHMAQVERTKTRNGKPLKDADQESKGFKVLAVTEAGVRASREYSAELGLDPQQRAWAGYVKQHDDSPRCCDLSRRGGLNNTS